MGAEHFYACLWDCLASNSGIRLPAISFVLAHFNKKLSMEEQKYIMGTNTKIMVRKILRFEYDIFPDAQTHHHTVLKDFSLICWSAGYVSASAEKRVGFPIDRLSYAQYTIKASRYDSIN